MAYSGAATMYFNSIAARSHTLHPLKGVSIQLKHFLGDSTPLWVSNSEQLGVKGYLKCNTPKFDKKLKNFPMTLNVYNRCLRGTFNY